MKGRETVVLSVVAFIVGGGGGNWVSTPEVGKALTRRGISPLNDSQSVFGLYVFREPPSYFPSVLPLQVPTARWETQFMMGLLSLFTTEH